MWHMPPNYRHRLFAIVDSTNAELRRLVKEGARPNLWISAESQSAGRGRRGRAWRSPAGNLYCSLYLALHEDPNTLAQLSFVAALSVADLVDELTRSEAGVSVKWPNDVLVRGKKISGILLENCGEGRDGTGIIIGIGVNLTHFPTDITYPATSIQDLTGHIIRARDALEFLAKRFDIWFTRWQNDGFGPIAMDWQRRCSTVGKKVTVSSGNERYEGIFVSLSDTGSARIQREDGSMVELLAGDIYPDGEKE